MVYVIIGVVVVLILLYLMITYNKLVKLRNKAKDKWASVDVCLKARADLIPNLVETVKGYAKHEKETLEAVISARNKAVSAKTTDEEIKSNNELSTALSRLLMIAENYPELKANENFNNLQMQLANQEEKIASARQLYNDDVLSYKNAIEMFPSNIVALIFRFKAMQFFEITEEDRKVPNVKF